MRTKLPFVLALLVLSAISASAADDRSLPFVSPIFGDNMVLQRGKPNKIWGWSKPGTSIQVKIAGRTAKTVAGVGGRWQLQIEPPATGGPYTITVSGPQTVTFRDVLVGDVWLCGGQSNMEFGLPQARDGAEEIKSANHPRIRLYVVSRQVSYSGAAVPQGSWKICSPQTVSEGPGFSAVAYFFARKVQQETNIPIGLIQDCIGGTPAEA
jgi:sialate O-acetylesterase